MLNEGDFTDLPSGQRFEMLFRWNNDWRSIIVMPVNVGVASTHYIVKLSTDFVIVLRINECGDWEELREGVTELARHLGKAIDMYYLAH